MPNTPLLSPEELHKRAEEQENAVPEVSTLPLFQTVKGFINSSTGHSRMPAPLYDIYTTEYTIIPVPGSMLDEEVPRVVAALKEAGFFVSIKDDALARFHEESLMIVCWDPRVIAASKAGFEFDNSHMRPGMCILPGREDNPCVHCFDCVQHFSSLENAPDDGEENNG